MLKLIVSLFLASNPFGGDADPREATAYDYVMHVVCNNDPDCVERRSLDVEDNVRDVIATCNTSDISDAWCMSLIVAATAEGGFRNHPTCAALNEACAQDCDVRLDGFPRAECLRACAVAEGKDGMAEKAYACNDHGTSRGAFQMKERVLASCARKPDVGQTNPHDMGEAAACYVSQIRAAIELMPTECQVSKANAWMIAMKRVGAGGLDCETRKVTTRVGSPMGLSFAIEREVTSCQVQCSESRYARGGSKLAKLVKSARVSRNP